MGPVVGIDLGTTNSAIAVIDEHGKPVIIPNAENERVTPSCVAFTEQGILVGSEAKNLKQAGFAHVAAFFKREMGNDQYLFPGLDKDYTATELSALVLGKLKNDAERYLNVSIKDVVITVPAYFRETERRNTVEAAKRAGLHVLSTINEPTAAALPYGLDLTLPTQRVLVYDLGGGTFDVTLLQLTENSFDVLASEGDFRLGGKDWDDRLMETLCEKFYEEFHIDISNDLECLGELVYKIEEAKMRLSSTQATTITLHYEGRVGKYEISQELFADITEDLLQRTASLCEKVLSQLGLCAKDVDNVLLVGGSSRMPMVHALLAQLFGKEPLSGVNVDEVVALGAALEAGRLLATKQGQSFRRVSQDPNATSKIATPVQKYAYSLPGARVVRDVTNHSLGAIAVSTDGKRYVNEILLTKNTPVPCNNAKQFLLPVRRSGTSVMDIYLTQGETDNPKDMTYLGKYVVRNIPGNLSGKARIEVNYSYNTSGMVHISAKDTLSGAILPVVRAALAQNEETRFLQRPEEHHEPVHTHIMLVVDLSASMEGAPLEEAKAAAHRFVDELDFSCCQVGLIAVADKSLLVCPLTYIAENIRTAIDSLCVGMHGIGFGNTTHPFDHIYDQLAPFVDERAVAVLLADGIWYNREAAENRVKHCHKAGIATVAIGFGTANKAFLQSLASIDEAGIFTPIDKLGETFSRIARVVGGKEEQNTSSEGMLGLLFKSV